MKNFHLIILTVLLFGVSSFFRKLAVDRIHPYQLQIVAGLVYAVEIPLWMWLLRGDSVIPGNVSGTLWGVACIVSHVAAAVLFGFLLKDTSDAGLVTLIASMGPLVTLLLSTVFLNESMTLQKAIACLLMTAGLFLAVK